jgi:hypothetical protein
MFLAVAEGFVFQGFVTFLPAFLAEVGGAGRAAAAKGAVLAGLSVRAAGPTVLGVALAGLFSLLIFLGQPITNQLVARSTRAGRRGAAYGTYFSLSFGVGALAGSAGGIVADRSGLAAVFGFLGLVAVINTLGGLAVRVLLDRRSESTDRASAA